MLPRATVERTSRERNGPGGRTQEIQRLIGRSLRAAMATMAFGEYTIRIDCDVLQADGGTRTASITGGCVALADACAWLAERTGEPSPFGQLVAAVSVGVVEGEERLDLAYLEDRDAHVDCQRRHAGARRGSSRCRAPASTTASPGRSSTSCSTWPSSGIAELFQRAARRCSAGEAAGRHAEPGQAARDPPDARAAGVEVVFPDDVGLWETRTEEDALELGETLRGQCPPQGRALRPAERPARPSPTIPGSRCSPWAARPGCAPAAGPGAGGPGARWTRPTTPSCCGGCAARPRRGAGRATAACWSFCRSPAPCPRSSKGAAPDGSWRRRAAPDGFGYDPLFFSDELGKTFGEATPEEKDRVSHRGRALRALAAALEQRPVSA